jgi:hypothetical protein
MATTQYLGGCHCGAVRFAVDLDLAAGAARCNCSVCTKIAATGAFAKPAAFTLRSSEADLGSYEWGAKISRRYFCKRCGIHCFGRGHLAELGGDFVSINVNTLDNIDPATLKVVYWDGRHDNWDAGPRDAPWPVHAAA